MRITRTVCAALLAAIALTSTAACKHGRSKGNPPSNILVLNFNPNNFAGDAVDNEFFPLRPGWRWVLEKETDEGLERVDVLVTNDTKVILGVACVVVHAVEYLDGELVEDTYDWYSQDAAGNVWYLGEDSKDYEDGVLVSTEGSWEAGVNGAKAGIIMMANPTVPKEYAQEFAPGVAEDRGRVVALGEAVQTPLRSFEGCLLTEDFTPLEPGVIEEKYYAPGIGPVLEVDEDGVRLELVELHYNPPFDPANFTTPGTNPYLPLVLGSVKTLEIETDEGIEQVRVEVTTDTKVILGVTCLVVNDVVTLDGELVEDTDDWFAVDRFGNVWYLGEDSKDYEGGVLVSTEGSWEAGVDDAEAGVLMFAEPILGVTYRQEYYEGVAEDMATIVELGAAETVEYGSFVGCLRTRDFTPIEPGTHEIKTYAPGVGLILEEDDEGERTELTDVQ